MEDSTGVRQRRPDANDATNATQAAGAAPAPPTGVPKPTPSRKELGTPLPGVAFVFLLLCLAMYVYMSTMHKGMVLCVLFILVFFTVNRAVAPVTRALWPGFDKLSVAKQAGWVNLVVSIIHAVVMSAAATWTTLLLWDEFRNPDWLRPTYFVSWAPFVTMSIGAGYNVVDTFDMLDNGMALKYKYLLLHHAAILVTFTLGLLLDLGLLYLVLTMLCEYNTIFLHLRQVLGFAGYTRQNSVMFRLVWWALFVTMYTARLPVHAYLAIRVAADRVLWPSFRLWATGMTAMVIFNVLNYQLNANISKVYKRMRNRASSKRVIAVDCMAHWLWPLGVVLGAFGLYSYFHDVVQQVVEASL